MIDFVLTKSTRVSRVLEDSLHYVNRKKSLFFNLTNPYIMLYLHNHARALNAQARNITTEVTELGHGYLIEKFNQEIVVFLLL